MAIGVAKRGKIKNALLERLGGGWEVLDNADRLYNPGAIILRRDKLLLVVDFDYKMFLRVRYPFTEGDRVVELPDIEAGKLAKLVAEIASMVAGVVER